ncbi:hypothetical protein Q3G72_006030 [Acer saccharum]|nr:hypothetical protein Q3G72_006030 [Acer saccharum]
MPRSASNISLMLLNLRHILACISAIREPQIRLRICLLRGVYYESYPGPIDPSVLYDQKLHISSAIWEGQDRGPMRCHEHTSKIDGWKLLKKQIDKLLTEKDPCAGVKSVVKKRLPKRVRQIREYYFLPWRSLPSTGRALPVELVPGCCWRSG